ncbi:MAG: hypothetical protein SF066_11495 [Thermoanaerobaculia bacterium]|nr:hypothetical protein [Thermoanaerobaculia bacterium]
MRGAALGLGNRSRAGWWPVVCLLAVVLPAACGQPPPEPVASDQLVAARSDPTPDRAARQAARAFWNQPATIAELGLTPAERERLDALVPSILESLQKANRDHRTTSEAWAAAVRSGDSAATTRFAAELVTTASAVARAQTEAKTRLVEALGPGPAQKLAVRYPKFMAAPWVRANRLVDTSDLGKYLEGPSSVVPK